MSIIVGKTSKASRTLVLCVSMLMLLILLNLAFTTTAWAKDWLGCHTEDSCDIVTDFGKTNKMTCFKKKSLNSYWLDNVTDLTAITYAKSSNTKVATIDSKNYVLKLKNPGDTTISLKSGGKSYAFKIKVYKYENPLKVFKIGKKNYASKYKNNNIYYISKASGKLKVKPAKGWKISRMKTYGETAGKKVKNGATIDSNSSYGINITCVNKSNGKKQLITLQW